MVPEPAHLQLFPLVCSVGQDTEFVVEPEGVGDELPDGAYRCELRHRSRSGGPVVIPAVRGADGRVRFRHAMAPAGEIVVTLQFPGERKHGLGSIFAVEPELAGLLPLRGDFHSHTWHSDGRSSPRELLQAAWRLGLDFIAVTDHDNWEGSREAVRLSRQSPIVVLPGEEVTFDRGHLVAVGTRSSVAERRALPTYESELSAIGAAAGEGLEGAGFAPAYARALWSTRTIRSLGGLAILAHPFWVAHGEYHLDDRVARRLFAEGELDAVELLGDVEFEDNMLSIALHTEMAGAGVLLPVVSNSDTHGLRHTLGWYWTVVFAASADTEGIVAAVRSGRCVACVCLPGEQLRIYGPVRLVQLAYFLHERYFTEQDRLHAAGDPGSPSSAGPVADYRRRCMGLSPTSYR